jgi:glycosyltransferase involved in cell wall biosynthesis
MPPRSVALVHDYLLVMRGGERTFAAMADCWPSAPIYTTLYDAGAVPRFAAREVHVSPLQRLGVGQAGFRKLLPLFPWAVGRLDLSGHDLVVSSSSAFAHGVRVDEGAQHVCYCHSPFRYVWHERARALQEVPAVARPLMGPVLDAVRRWDVRVSRNVDHYIANGRITQDRIRSAYGREAPIVYPPVETDRFTPTAGGEYALIVCELVPHKRVDVALDGISRAGIPAVVVGAGPEQEHLQAAFPAARFAGRVDDAELARLYQGARAVIVPSYEEFGIVAVEAQAAGTPVVAPRRGGAGETVLDERTGILLDDVDAPAIARALGHEVFAQPDLAGLRAQADRFSVPAFQRTLLETVAQLTG